ncbi:alpha/beta fold hydrolase [Megalodesulfovibrio paquesii]
MVALLDSNPQSATGPVLLALHGGMGGWDQSWLLTRAALGEAFCREQGVRVLAVSRPGYPGTPLPAVRAVQPEYLIQGDCCAAVLDALQLERALVLAVSAGGPAALGFALQHPERCAGVVLVSACTGRLEPPARVRRMLPLFRLMAHVPGLPALLRRRARRHPGQTASKSIHDAAVRERTLADPEAGAMLQELFASIYHEFPHRLPGTIRDTAAFATMEDIPVAGLAVPVLGVHGTADTVVPFSHGQRVATQAPRAMLQGIPGGEHVCLFTHLTLVRETVREFAVQCFSQP